MQASASISKIANVSGGGRSANEVAERLLPFVVVFLAACFMFFAALGDYPLFNPDESLYAEPAREMLDTGEYITTLLNYVVRFTKPPLVIWAMAGAYKVFGVNEFAARFFGAACGTILVAVTYLFLQKYANKRAALIAAASLVTAPLFIGTAREAITDMPLSLFIFGALIAFFHGYKQQEGRWRWLGYVLLGLAVMTKGPVGLILPVAILGAYHLIRGEVMPALRYYKPVLGLLVVAAIAVPWFAVEIYVTKGAYYQEFLVRENFQRFTSVVDHKGAWWYHIAAVAGGYLPWSIFAPQALWQAISAGWLVCASAGGESGAPAPWWRTRNWWRRDEDALPLFCTLTFLAVVVFFSMAVSKLLPYTLPGFPALAALVGVYLDRCISEGKRAKLAVPLLVLSAAFAVALYVVPIFIVKLRELPPDLPHIIQSGLFALLALCLSCAIAVWRKHSAAAVGFFAVCVYLAFVGYGKQALDILSSEWEGPVPSFSQFAAQTDEPIVVWHMRKPSIPFYAHRKVLIPLDEQQLRQTVDSSERAYIIAKVADLPVFSNISGCRVLVKQGRFALVHKQPE